MNRIAAFSLSARVLSWLAPVVIVSTIAIAYKDTLPVPFLLDDVLSIQHNDTLASLVTALSPPPESGVTVSGRPILNLSFAVSKALGDGSLAAHHLVNIAVHIANSWLLFGLINGTLRASEIGSTIKSPHVLALAIALLWSLHPLQTASITYLAQRAEALAVFFYLSTLYFFLRAQSSAPFRSRLLLSASVTACALGMASKEVVVSAPLIVLFYDRAFFSRTFASAWNAKKSYFLSLALTWIILALCLAQSGSRGNTAGLQSGVPWIHYIYTQTFALTQYVRLMFWPSPLVFDYGRELIQSFSPIAWKACLVLLTVAWVVRRWIKNTPIGFLGILALALLAPTTLIPISTQTIAEHRFYLALAPGIIAVIFASARLLGENRTGLLAALLSTGLVLLTIDRNRYYQSMESIWADTLAKRPQNDRAWHSMGYVYLEKGLTGKAREAFHKAVQLRSDPINIIGYAHALTESGQADEAIYLYREALAAVPRSYGEVYESMANLGLLLGQKGQREEAIRWLNDAIDLNPKKTGAHYNLGALYVSLNLYDDAVRHLRLAVDDPRQGDQAKSLLIRALLSSNKPKEALALAERIHTAKPGSLELLLAYAQALAGSGKIDDAVREYQAVIAKDPSFPSARTQLGILYFATRRLDDARHHLELAVDQNPADHIALSTLAEVLLKSGALDEAVPRFEAALRFAPADHKSRYQLANSLLQLGRFDDAVIHYQILVRDRSAPLAEIHNELAIAYAQKGDFSNARVHFTECLRIKPDHTGASENLRRLPAP
jgi:tetratricopeptide (TPR) repeat protein